MDFSMGKLAIKQIADREGISVKEVKKDMETAIKEGYKNPETRKKWVELFGEERLPTPEEFICMVSKEVKK